MVRNGFVESVHHGLAAVTAPDGALAHAVGDATTPVFPRSSAKPLQAVAMVRSGARLSVPHLALACASHSGEDVHLAGVTASLAASGLALADLDNTPDFPVDEDARIAWIRAGRPRAALAQNCSGKHAGMLAACVAAGWPTAGYRDPGHPLQALIRATVADLAGERIVADAIDGCGAPIHAFPLVGLARAFGRIAAATDGPERRVADAMRTHPDLVGGTGRDATLLMQDVAGLIAKDGAEGVFAVGLPDGRGFAVKIVDGSTRARGVLLAELLRGAPGVSDAALARLATSPVLGHGEPVGAVTPVPSRTQT